LWDKVEREYETCSEVLASQNCKDTITVMQSKYDYCYTVYERYAANLNEIIEDSRALQSVQSSNLTPSQGGCRLPPVECEVFNGDYVQWPTFRDLFSAIYIRNPRLSEVEKLFHLNAKTSGEAKSIVALSPLTNDGFDSAWRNLQNRLHLGIKYSARALIDSGSEATFISERLFNLIKLPYESIQAQVSGVNLSVAAQPRKRCQLNIGSPVKPHIQIETCAYVLPQLAGNLPSYTLPEASLKDLPPLQLADPNFFRSSQIDVLIGADILPSILLSGSHSNICGTLVGQETIFGWILCGPIATSPTSRICSFSSRLAVKESKLDSILTKFWEVEDVPVKLVKESTSVCEENFIRSTKRSEDGKYVVSLPFKEPDNIKLGHSRPIALAQYLRNEMRLSKDLPLKEQYDSVIREYLDLGHMHQVSPDDSNSFYLPHHAVFKPDSTTTKVRVVFNASNPSSNGNSLNDILHAGPVLQSDLTIQILQWRFFQYDREATVQTRAESKVTARRRSFENCQNRWDSSQKGRWTHTFIPGGRMGMVDFYLIQVISRHCCFRSYLKRFGHEMEDWCPECDSGVVKDAQHVVFECHRFDPERHELVAEAGSRILAEKLVPMMLADQRVWEAAAKSLRELERRRTEQTE
ncbi:hypothetical protein KR059_001064, partial [Drosophila kikkawai]